MRGIVIDSSALIAVLEGEPEAATFAHVIEGAEDRHMSPFTLFEASVVITSRRGGAGKLGLDALRSRHRINVEPMTEDMAAIAYDAWVVYGKGRHPAGLNLGDCCSYALAKALGLPLLFKGDDFGKTDTLLAAPAIK